MVEITQWKYASRHKRNSQKRFAALISCIVATAFIGGAVAETMLRDASLGEGLHRTFNHLANTLLPSSNPVKIVSENVPIFEIDPVKTSIPAQNFHSNWERCGKGKRVTCVVDGDTVWLDGEKIRVADIDTPEITNPKCRSERERGERAANRLVSLLNQGAIRIEGSGDRDKDKYGRLLRTIAVNGRGVGDILIREELARPWTGQRRPWC